MKPFEIIANVTKEQFIELHVNQRKSLKDIATGFGVNPDMLSLHVRNNLGLSIVKYRDKKYASMADDFKNEVVKEYLILKSTLKVSSKLGLPRTIVIRILKDENINIRKIKNEVQSERLKYKTQRTNQEYIDLCKEKNITPLDLYVGTNHNINHKCDICDNIWNACPGNVLHRDTGCPECAIRESARKRSLDPEIYTQRLAEYCPNLEVLEDYVTYSTKILHRCKTCNYEWKTLPICRPTISGCRQCVSPHGQFGIPTTVDGILFDSMFEATCYEELLNIFSANEITHKKWYSNGKYCSDFYISKLDLWIEVSVYNNEEYLEKIYNKRKLVKNFAFFQSLEQIKDYFKEKING